MGAAQRTLVGVLAALAVVAPPAAALERGVPAAPDRAGPVVYLEDDAAGRFCTGTLVGPRTVLTAAHCVSTRLPSGSAQPAAPASLWAAGGATTLGAASRAGVAAVALHPAYRPGNSFALDHDAAVVRLAAPLAAPAAPVAPAARVPASGTYAGWGTRQAAGFDGLLREGAATVLPDAVCEAGRQGAFDGATMLCTPDQDAASAVPCPGDSGGPLLALEEGAIVVAGIVSAADCGVTGQHAVLTEVAAPVVRDWLLPQVPRTAIEVRDGGGEVVLRAVPAGGPALDRHTWDLDGDGATDDATGPEVAVRPAAAVRVTLRSANAEGDAATATTVVPGRPPASGPPPPSAPHPAPPGPAPPDPQPTGPTAVTPSTAAARLTSRRRAAAGRVVALRFLLPDGVDRVRAEARHRGRVVLRVPAQDAGDGTRRADGSVVLGVEVRIGPTLAARLRRARQLTLAVTTRSRAAGERTERTARSTLVLVARRAGR